MAGACSCCGIILGSSMSIKVTCRKGVFVACRGRYRTCMPVRTSRVHSGTGTRDDAVDHDLWPEPDSLQRQDLRVRYNSDDDVLPPNLCRSAPSALGSLSGARNPPFGRRRSGLTGEAACRRSRSGGVPQVSDRRRASFEWRKRRRARAPECQHASGVMPRRFFDETLSGGALPDPLGDIFDGP